MYLKSNSKSESLSRNIRSPPHFQLQLLGCYERRAIQRFIDRLGHRPNDDAALSKQRVKPRKGTLYIQIRYDTRCYFNVRSNVSLIYRTEPTTKSVKQKKTKK